MPIVDFGKESTTSLLNPRNANYYIPDNQRTFSWGPDQVEDLFEDIRTTYEEKSKGIDNVTHFMGMIVLYTSNAGPDKGRVYVYDGQQRMTNLLLFFQACSDILKEIGEANQETKIISASNALTGRYIYEDQMLGKGEEFTFSLTLGKQNDAFIKKYIYGRKTPPIEKNKITETNALLYKAYQYYKTGVEEMMKEIKEDDPEYVEKVSDFVIRLQNIVGSDFLFLVVKTDDINQAYEIFETLNARGKELETADLLKNHLLMNADSNNASQIKDNWDMICTELSQQGMNGVTRYLRYYWNSKHKFVRDRDLFRKLRKEYPATKISKKLRMVEDLSKYVRNFRNLVDEHYSDIYNEDVAMREAVSDIRQLGLTSYIPIILAISDKPETFSSSDITKTINYLLNYIVRNIIIGKQTANKNEIMFASIARKITDGEYCSVEQIRDELKGQIIEDDQFVPIFVNYSTTKSNYIRYILRKLNNEMYGGTVSLKSSTEVHIEHIMPKTPEDKAKQKEADYKNYLWRLGNLTFLRNTDNISISNKEYAIKKEAYKNSDLKLTNMLPENYEKWDYETIVLRQKQLSEIAKEIWKL